MVITIKTIFLNMIYLRFSYVSTLQTLTHATIFLTDMILF